MNRGALANTGIDAWTYSPFLVRAVAASGTPVDPIFDQAGSPLYNWVRYNQDLDGQVTVQYQIATVGSFSEGSGADAWCFLLPVPARTSGVRGEFPLGTAIAYRSFTEPFINMSCTPVLADPDWPQLRGDAGSWFQLAVPYCWQTGTATITGGAGSGESTTVSHALGYAPKAYDIMPVVTDPSVFSSGATAFITIQNIDTDSFDLVAMNVNSGNDLPISWKIQAEPQTGNPWLGPRKPFYWASSATFNLFIQLRYEAA